MIIKQIFTEPETEVKWYFDNIDEIVIVYIRNRHFCLHLLHSASTSKPKTSNPKRLVLVIAPRKLHSSRKTHCASTIGCHLHSEM